ncbi:MAG TPA: LpxD N-terminal domain-containing protein, partial [Roseimicrobium sp.]|nr:LpxD N-terminal domain-containing protein [Roseimicrobium sp.]
MPFTAAEIAAQLQGEVVGNPDTKLTGFAPAATALEGDLTFAENESYLAKAEESAAGAILVGLDVAKSTKTLIRVKNPRVAFARVLPLFFPEHVFAPGIHSSAVVSKSAKIDPSAHIGPCCTIEDNVVIGPRCVLQACNYVGEDTTIGEDTRIFPNATIYPQSKIGTRVRIHAGSAIGSDGFGY